MSKVGRNEKCPCGSGKKFKKCCSNKSLPTLNPPIPEKTKVTQPPKPLDYNDYRRMKEVPKDFFFGHLFMDNGYTAGDYAYQLVQDSYPDDDFLQRDARYISWMNSDPAPTVEEIMSLSGVSMATDEDAEKYKSWGFPDDEIQRWMSKEAFQFLDFTQKTTQFKVKDNIVYLPFELDSVPSLDPRKDKCSSCELDGVKCNHKWCSCCGFCEKCCECNKFDPWEHSPSEKEFCRDYPLEN